MSEITCTDRPYLCTRMPTEMSPCIDVGWVWVAPLCACRRAGALALAPWAPSVGGSVVPVKWSCSLSVARVLVSLLRFPLHHLSGLRLQFFCTGSSWRCDFFFSLFFLCLSPSIQSFVLLLSGHLGADNVAYTCVGSAPYPDDILVCRIYWKLPAKRSCNSEWSAPLIQAWTEISALDVLPLCCFHHVCLRAGRIWLNHSTPPLMCKRGSSLKFHISCIFHVVWVIMFTHPEGWRKQRAEIAVYAFQNSLWKAA